MRVRRRSSALFVCAVMFAAAHLGACDPKVLADGSGGNDDNDDEDDLPQISQEAIAAGQVVALHMDLIAKSLSLAAEFDTASTPAARSIFPTSCITATTIDETYPWIDLSLDDCVDSRGTDYRGKALLAPPVDETDGYLLTPYFDAADKIIATNASNTVFNHTVESGSLIFKFTRGTNGQVSKVEVTNFLRHSIFATVASFSYTGVFFSGSLGSLPQWPAAGGEIQVAWDDVGVFTVELGASTHATFTLRGVAYSLNLSTGDVTLAAL